MSWTSFLAYRSRRRGSVAFVFAGAVRGTRVQQVASQVASRRIPRPLGLSIFKLLQWKTPFESRGSQASEGQRRQSQCQEEWTSSGGWRGSVRINNSSMMALRADGCATALLTWFSVKTNFEFSMTQSAAAPLVFLTLSVFGRAAKLIEIKQRL